MREGWTYKKIGDLCDITTGKLDANAANENGMYPFFTCSKDPLSINTYAYDCECVLIAGNGDLNVKYYNGKFNAYQRTYILSLKEEIDGTTMPYIYNFFLLYVNELRRKSIGGIIKYIKLGDLANANIPVPSLSEQQSIVAELDKINELISLKKAQLSDLDSLAQSIFYDMFGDPIENGKEWEVKKLGEICNIGTGATPSRIQENRYYGGNIPWVKTTEVCYQDIYDTEEKITPLAIEETNCKLYPEGTLLMAMYGQGKTRGQVAKLMVPAATNQACAAIIVNVEKLHIDYLYMFLIIQYDNIRAMAQGGNQANLNMKLVGSISIPLPPLSLQQEFAKRIELIEQQKAQISSTIKDLETLLASRMQYWFD